MDPKSRHYAKYSFLTKQWGYQKLPIVSKYPPECVDILAIVIEEEQVQIASI